MAGERRTVLFVSDDMGTIRSCCQRKLFLGEGLLGLDVPVGHVVDGYLQRFGAGNIIVPELKWDEENTPSSQVIRFRQFGYSTSGSRQFMSLASTKRCYWNWSTKASSRLAGSDFALHSSLRKCGNLWATDQHLRKGDVLPGFYALSHVVLPYLYYH